MAKPLLFVENFYSRLQFPGHTVTATEEPSTHELFRAANGRRSPYDYWTGSTANLTQSLQVDCGRVRAANCLAIDRGHNVSAKSLTLYANQDNFSISSEAILNAITIPSASTPGGNADEDNGVRTEEGLWFKRFPQREVRYWRTDLLNAASFIPRLVGIQLGYAWECEYWTRPVGEGLSRLTGDVSESASGWRARTTPTKQKVLTLKLRLTDFVSYDQARYHLEGHFASGRPMLLVLNQDQADRALQVEVDGPIGFNYETDYGYEQVTFSCVEHEPLRAL